MTTPQLFFGYFAAAMTVLALLVVTRRNAVHSVVWMLVLFMHIAGLYLFLNADFLAAIQIIVYSGAIMVLFLFVIMLLNLRQDEKESKFQKQWPFAAAAAATAVTFIVMIAGNITVIPALGEYSIDAVSAEGSLMTIGKILYTQYIFPFEAASLILLVAIIGAVVLAKRRVL